MIVVGVDADKRTHTLVVVDAQTGAQLGQRTIDARDEGHLDALRFIRGLVQEQMLVWAIEDCRHVSGHLERDLIAFGEQVIRVSPTLMGASRRGQREPGKSDPIDALAVARTVNRLRGHLLILDPELEPRSHCAASIGPPATQRSAAA